MNVTLLHVEIVQISETDLQEEAMTATGKEAVVVTEITDLLQDQIETIQTVSL